MKEEPSKSFNDIPGSNIDNVCLAMDTTVEDPPVLYFSPYEERNGGGNCRGKRHIRRKVNIGYLLRTICASRENCIEWLKNRGLIPRIMFCPKCNRKMKFEANEQAIDGYIWICKECTTDRPTFTTRHGSWLETNNAPLVDILLFTYFWAHGYSEDHLSKELNRPLSAIREWSDMYSNICESLYQKKMGREEDLRDGNIADTTTKESYVAVWRRNNKYKDPFLQFLTDADSL